MRWRGISSGAVVPCPHIVCDMENPGATRFKVSVHRAHGCYFARVIDLPGCVARGATEVEAVENARVAIRAFVWVAQLLASDPAIVQVEISA